MQGTQTEQLAYYVGIVFKSNQDEYTHNPTLSPLVAFETAKIGASNNYHRVTFYVASGNEVIEIPFSELSHLNMKTPNLESEIEKIVQQKLNSKSTF